MGILGWCLIGVILSVFFRMYTITYSTDDEIVEINRIVKEVELHRDTLEELASQRFAFSFAVLDSQGTLLDSFGEKCSQTAADGIRNGDMILQTGDYTLLISMDRKEKMTRFVQQTALFFWIFSGILVVAAIAGILYVRNQILRPFEQMKGFAASVASGNLDIPLTMGKKQYFGAYTESFDLMREELNKAREQEYQANVSKKELVATLSHDIKTPVTSIKLMCEVLQAKLELGEQNQQETMEKLDSIYAKAGQIDNLISDMFQSTLEDLGEQRIQTSEETSDCVEEMVKRADFRGKVREYLIPPQCLICIDRLRLEQVIGNIINNSYKYANTEIEVTYQLSKDFLQISVRDFGIGVDGEELPHIFQKFYRGTNARSIQQAGAGLGLYICDSLMEKMNGNITGENVNPGFCVRIFVPLV